MQRTANNIRCEQPQSSAIHNTVKNISCGHLSDQRLRLTVIVRFVRSRSCVEILVHACDRVAETPDHAEIQQSPFKDFPQMLCHLTGAQIQPISSPDVQVRMTRWLRSGRLLRNRLLPTSPFSAQVHNSAHVPLQRK